MKVEVNIYGANEKGEGEELSSLRSQLEYWNTGIMGELVLDKMKYWQNSS